MISGDADPFGLHKACYGHGERRKEYSDANPLEHRDARGESGELSGDRDKDSIIESDAGKDTDAGKDLKRSWGYGEMGAERSSQSAALLSEVGAHLCNDQCKCQATQPHGNQAEEKLHFLYLCH